MTAASPLRLVAPASALPAHIPAPPAEVRFGRFELQISERRLLMDGHPVPLQPRALDLLTVLAERPGQLVSRQALLDRVWADRVVEEGNLNVQINALRRRLGSGVIATVPGYGYRFVPDKAAVVRAVAAATPPDAGTHLPAVMPQLVGRSRELAALAAAADGHALVSVVGTGGVGKTRLVQALLQARRSRHAQGVCFVDLSVVEQASMLPATIAAALGMRLSIADDALPALARTLAPLDILLALDNAEHMLHDVAAVARALRAGAPGVRLLVTSQAPLKVDGERVFRLGAMSLPTFGAPLQDMLAHDAVALFVTRAQAAGRGFVADTGTVRTIAELCRRLDGNALAIELAAARAHLLGLPTLLSSLEGRLGVLTAGRPGAPARQRTLRAALDWSHDFLNAEERAVFRRLAVFTGSASLATVLAVIADPSPAGTDAVAEWAMLDALGNLVDRSLVEVLQPIEGAGETPAPRYRLLDTQRVYARERLLASGELAAVQRRHMAAHATLLANSYQSLLDGNIGFDACRAGLSADVENARAAMHCAIGLGDAETALRVATVLTMMFCNDRTTETRALWAATEGLLDAPGNAAAVPLPVRARAALAFGASAVWRNRNSALARTRQAVAWFGETAERPWRYMALCQLGWLQGMAGNRDELRQTVEQALALQDESWSPYVQSLGVYGPLYWLAMLEDRQAEAAHYSILRLHVKRAAGWQDNAAEVTRVVQLVVAGQLDEAITVGRELVSRLSGARQPTACCQAQIVVIDALLRKSMVAEARELQGQAWPLACALGMQTFMVDNAAWLAALERRPRAALRLLGHSDATLAAAEDQRGSLDQVDRDRTERMARDCLGDAADGEVIARLLAEGSVLGQAALTALALGNDDA
jgi:predicted ATPase/DNA-binding winged helix-turn-helix (wHTH) protein